MTDSTTPRARMTRDIGAGSASSGSPLAPPKASPCVLDRLDLARPRAHTAAKSTISGGANGRERRVHRFLLLRRELDLRLALVQLLHVQAGLVAVDDRRHDTPGAAGVEQRQRARLVPRQLVVGVVAD